MIESKCITTYSIQEGNIITGTYESCSYNLGSLEKTIDTLFTGYNLGIISIIVSIYIFYTLYKKYIG